MMRRNLSQWQSLFLLACLTTSAVIIFAYVQVHFFQRTVFNMKAGEMWIFYRRSQTVNLGVQSVVQRGIPSTCVWDNLNTIKALNLARCCRLPNIDLLRSEEDSAFPEYSILRCDNGIPSVVHYDDGFLKVDLASTREKLRSQWPSVCRYRSLTMKPGGDFSTLESPWSFWFREEIEVDSKTEHFLVECEDRDANVVAKSYISVLQEDQVVERKLKDRRRKHRVLHSPLETLSVLAIGIDGMSRQDVIRSLPQTRRFLLQQLDGFQLLGLNRNGINMFSSVITMLTGSAIKSYPEYWDFLTHFDDFDFIWDEYARAGYRTQLVLDSTRVTPFHYSEKGWTQSPVHHDIRPLVVASESDFIVRGNDSNCIGDVPEITHLTDYILQLVTASNGSSSKPYFSFAFLKRLTHDDPHKAMMGDELYLQFFQKLHARRLLNNTALFFFSDHGPRFGPSRRTVNGMFEERMPFCFLALPRWFLKKYPHINTALSANQHRLTSHYDLHATLKDILYFKGQSGLGNLAHKGISLFSQVPRERSCLDAGLHLQWCSCHQYTLVDPNDSLVQRLAKSFAEGITSQTHSVRHLCHSLRLARVLNAMIVRPAAVYRNWYKVVVYQIIIETIPGAGIYEGMLAYSAPSETVGLVGIILRLNDFQEDSSCADHLTLKQFCHCKAMNATT